MKTQHGGKRYGFFSGALWGLDTVVLAIALAMTPFLDFGQSALAGAVLHDVACALILLVYMGVRGRLTDTVKALRTRPGKSVIVAALLGGPIGMSGYLIAIDNIGPGLTAIISTFYPALGTLLAFILLKERMAPRQIAALLVALGAIVATGWSATSEPIEGGNAILGVVGALACVIGWGSEAVILTWGMRDEAVDNEVALQIRETTSAVVYLFIVAPIAGVFGFTLHSLAHLSAGVVALAGLAGTASYLFYYKALSAIGASRGMALNISYSAWAIIFALAFPPHTIPTLTQVICCIVILVGTVLAATSNWGDLLPKRTEKVTSSQA
ncbi:MAG: DMT family transporter [Actinomyces sp.]|nr:DMT family transporter [Actinomyces sp.]